MATEPDIAPAVDRGEGIAAMQPMKIGEGGVRFRDAVDLALELTAKSAAFRSSLPPAMRTGLADLVRAMNCYYSNLIEGATPTPSISSGRSRTTSAPTRQSATCSWRRPPISRCRDGSTAAAWQVG